MTAVEALRECRLLSTFTDTGIQILANVSVPRSFPAGSILFTEQSSADSMFVIAKGRVLLSTRGERSDISLGELGSGDCLGEVSLVAPGQRMCTATAGSAVTAFELRHVDFQKLMGSKPQACMKLMMAICANLGTKVGANRETLKAVLAR